MVYKFTKCGEKVLSISNELAIDLGHSYIGTEHILYGLVCEENGVAGKALIKQNLTPEDILDEIGALPKAVRLNNAFIDRLVGGASLDSDIKDKIKAARCEITENKTFNVVKPDRYHEKP